MDEKRNCPKCGNPNCESDHEYCWNCGIKLGNYCSNAECPQIGMSEADEYVTILPDRFRFCPYCGSQSHYAQAGYIPQLEFEV